MTIAQTGATDASQAPTSHDRVDVWERVRGGIAFAILLAIFITLNPFSDLGDPKVLELSSGNEAATYVTLFLLVALAALLLQLSGRLPLHLLATRENLLLLAWLVVVSVALSADPGTSARRFVLSFTAFLLAAMLPWLTRGSRHFAGLLLALAALALVLSCIGILVAPHLTIHQATDLGEPEIAGDWRGVFGHKNLAASMMAVFIYVGWFAARRGRPLMGTLVALAAFVFLLMSGGKSALGLVFIVAAIAFFVARARSIRTKALFASGPLVLLGFLTVGSVASTAAASFLRALPIDVTFTGRTEISVVRARRAARPSLEGLRFRGVLVFRRRPLRGRGLDALDGRGGDQPQQLCRSRAHHRHPGLGPGRTRLRRRAAARFPSHLCRT